jgi:hypothetical protein
MDTQALRNDADEIEACGGGNEAARLRLAAAEIERLRSALAALVSDLDARAVEGFVDCSASVWIGANAALAPLDSTEAK